MVDISKIIEAVTKLRAGILLIIASLVLIAFSAVDSMFGIQLIQSTDLREKIYYIGSFFGLLGAYFSWHRADREDRKSRQATLDQWLQTFSEKLDRVYKEVIPNGGSSMRDSISHIHLMAQRMDQRQLALVSDMDKPVFETGPHGEWSYVNAAYCKMVGRSRHEVRGAGWLNTISAETRQHVFEEWQLAVTQKRDFEMRLHFVSSDGSSISGECKARRLTDQDDNTLGYMGLIVPMQAQDRQAVQLN